MILAEVKISDDSQFQWRLFNCNLAQFRSMADKRFVVVGRIAEVDTEVIKIIVKAAFNE